MAILFTLHFKKDVMAKAKEKSPKQSEKGEQYNRYKQFDGKRYTGMKVGGSHKWHYDAGDWRETKITPELWEISYAVTKRRAGHAPTGTGAPVGTGYHWFILAHQIVDKLNENDYATAMMGLKFKLAHRRVGEGKWNASITSQRKHLIDFLKRVISQLEIERVPINFEHNDKAFKGEALPLLDAQVDGHYFAYEVTLNDEFIGIIRKLKSGWKMKNAMDQKHVNAIGKEIDNYFKL